MRNAIHGWVIVLIVAAGSLLVAGCASNGDSVNSLRTASPQAATQPGEPVNPRTEEGPGINLSAFFRNPAGSLRPSPVVDDVEYAEYLEWKRWQEYNAYLKWKRQRQSN